MIQQSVEHIPNLHPPHPNLGPTRHILSLELYGQYGDRLVTEANAHQKRKIFVLLYFHRHLELSFGKKIKKNIKLVCLEYNNI